MSGVLSHSGTVPYDDELDRIESESPHALLRFTSVGLALFIAVMLAIASVTRVNMVVTGRGRLAADHPTVVLQPLQRAIIRSLRVRAGDTVHQGQILATLDPTFAAADLAALQAKQHALAAEIIRLRAEDAGAPYTPFANAPEDTLLQAGLYRQRQREYSAHLASFDAALAHDAAERATLQTQRTALTRQAAIAAQILQMRDSLLRGAVGSRLQYLDADATLARATGDLRGATARLAELAQSATSHRADRAAFIESWRRDVLENLAARRTDLAETEAAISKAAHVQDLISVTAPQDGVVLETTSRAPGSILGEAEPLATLLPAHAGLQAELTIKSADIGYIRTGDTVSLKIDAYPFQRHGMLSGRVRAIAAASFDQGAQDPTPVHRVAIDLTSATLTDLPQGTGPTPGMTLSGDVNIGTRSVLAYFLTPITGGLRQSLREP